MTVSPAIGKDGAPASAGARITVLAPAKVNLFLHILGRRDDGRHELESIFAFADIGDRLFLEPAEDYSLSLSGAFAGDLRAAGAGGDDNLVITAARKLAARLGAAASPVRLELEKNLPVASGIGGGSADAAAALSGLCDLWNSGLPAEEMQALALELGADVPSCLRGATARIKGIGDIIESGPPVPPLPAVLVNPNVPLSTAAVFQGYKESGAAFSDPLIRWPDSTVGDFLSALAACRNDLYEAASAKAAVLPEVMEKLQGLAGCRLARMSGSGATCFGLFDDRETAEKAAHDLNEQEIGWWVAPVMLGGGVGRSGKTR